MRQLIVLAVLGAFAFTPAPAQPPLKKKEGPRVGDRAPDFELKFLAEKRLFKLSDNFGKKPTLLIFHSFT